MLWNHLTSEHQLNEAEKDSFNETVLIYKHSYRCGISAAALGRLERGWPAENGPKPFFIDVVKSREISDLVSSRYHVQHESPQILLIQNGKCTLSRSHFAVDVSEFTV